MDDKNQETARPTKVDISKPKDFKHVVHVGLNTNTGNTLRSKKDKMPKTSAPEADRLQNENEIESNLDQASVSLPKTHGELYDDKEDPTELQHYTMDDKNQVTARPTKVDISKPKDFKHVMHVGMKTNTGNTLRIKKDKMPKPPAPETDQSLNEDEIESNLNQTGVSVPDTHGELHDDKEDPTEFQSNTLKRRSKLTKEDIGYPYNFKHVSHVGWDTNRGFDLDETSYTNELKSFFAKAGVSDIQLRNQETRDFIYDFIETHGGLDTVRGDLHNMKRNNTLKKKKKKIPEPPKADQSQNKDELKSFFEKAGVSDIQLQDQETREFIYDFIERHGGLDAAKEELHDVNSNNTLKRRKEKMPKNPKADQSQNADEVKSFLDKAGVSDIQLQDQETREFIYDFIKSQGRPQAVNEELHNVMRNNTLNNKKEKISDTTKDDQSQNADESKSFFDKAGVSDKQLQDQETREFIYNFIESHWGFNEYMSYHLRRTRQKNGDIGEPQDFKHVLHVECEANTSDDDTPNADELKSSPGVSDTPQEDQEPTELGNESRGDLDGDKKNLRDDKSRRRAPQPPPTPKTPVATLSHPSPSTPSGVTAPIPTADTASSETSDQVAPSELKPSPPSPSTTKTTTPVSTDDPATSKTSPSSTEAPPSPTLSTTATSTASTTSTVTSTVSTLSPPSPSSSKVGSPSKVTPPVASRRFAPLPLVNTMTSSVPTLNVELTKPLKIVVPMPTIKPGSPLPTVRSTDPIAPSTASTTTSNTTPAMAPVPTLRSAPPPSPGTVPRPARRLAPAHPARTPDSPTSQLKDNCDTPTKTKDRLYKLVANGKYTMAVDLVKTLDKPVLHEVMSETIQKLLDSHSTAKAKLMSFAYKLWHSDAKSVVRIHFPLSFKLILGREDVKIVNKGYRQALKLDASIDNDNGRHAWGDARDKSSKRVSWQLVPVWENNEVTFKLHNVDCNMFLKLGVEVDNDGDRAAWGSPNADTDSHRYYLEPHMEDEDLVFFIINYQCGQGLKLVVTPDDKGDRALVGHKGDIYRDEARFRWIISAW